MHLDTPTVYTINFPLACGFLSLLGASLLGACGGDIAVAPPPQAAPPAAEGPPQTPPVTPPGTAPITPPVTPPSPPASAPLLTVSTSSLALAVSGQPRHFVVSNLGGQTALNLRANALTPLPAGSSLSTDCDSLSPGASCTLTVTPGATPSASPADTAPAPVQLSLSGSNTAALALSLWVLDFGSVYQGGYVFDLKDSTPATAGVGGKVMALEDAWPATVVANDSPASSSPVDGASNTADLIAAGGPPPFPNSPYAAWVCGNSDAAGFTDWYLPAICELGYDRDNRGSGCGTASAPTLSNISSHLVDKGLVGNLPSLDEHHSSTGSRGNHWVQFFRPADDLPGAAQHEAAGGEARVRCVRALTP